MALFLQIVAGFFVAMILFVFVAYFLLRFYLRRAAKNFGKALAGMSEAMEAVTAATPPDRIHLKATTPVQFADTASEKSILDALSGEGFTDLGYYTIEELPAVKTHAMMNVEQAVYALIHELEPVGVVLDLVCEYPDGTSCTYSTTQETGLERPPGHVMVKDPGADPRAPYRRLIAERKSGPFVPVSADRFARAFEKAYADEQDWRNIKGGLSEAEIRRIAARSGEEVSENVINLAVIAETSRAREATQRALKERFYESARSTQQQRDELGERLLVIHDRTAPDDVVAALAEAIPDSDSDDNDDDEDEDPRTKEAQAVAATEPPRQAFARLNSKLPANRRYKKLGEITQPIGADIYDAPWRQDEDEDEDDEDEED